MTRSELVKRLADENPDLPPETVRRVVDTIFSEVTGGLADGRRAEFRDFGTFSVKRFEPRQARNPKTGGAFQTSGTTAVRFRIGKGLNERLNPGLAERD